MITVCAVVLLVFLAGFLSSKGDLVQRLEATPTHGSAATILNRQGVWQEFLQRIDTGTKVVVGTGPGSEFAVSYPHSLYIFMLYTQGVVGLALLGVFFLSVVWRLLTKARRNPRAAPLRLIALLLVLFLLDEVKVEFTRLFGYQVFIWGLVGLGLAACRVYSAEERRFQGSRRNSPRGSGGRPVVTG